MNNNLLDWKLQDIVTELSHLESFTYVMESEIRNASQDEINLSLTNKLIACLVMQETKIKELITTMEELVHEVKKSNDPDIDIETLLKVYRGELPESAIDDEALNKTFTRFMQGWRKMRGEQ